MNRAGCFLTIRRELLIRSIELSLEIRGREQDLLDAGTVNSDQPGCKIQTVLMADRILNDERDIPCHLPRERQFKLTYVNLNCRSLRAGWLGNIRHRLRETRIILPGKP